MNKIIVYNQNFMIFVIPTAYLGEQSLTNSWQYASPCMTHACRMNYCKSIPDLRGLLAVLDSMK